ncbi:MAG: very short patch repair endonuclease [Phycisphaerae bacterium]
MDVLTKKQRSYCMSRIRKKDTTPEMVVRRLIHSYGYRYRLHRSDLPGCPDIVMPCHKKVIFVHGCWWHRHNCHLGRRSPKSRLSYWLPKLRANKERHKRNLRRLRNLGWKVLTVWECQTLQPDKLRDRILNFLE